MFRSDALPEIVNEIVETRLGTGHRPTRSSTRDRGVTARGEPLHLIRHCFVQNGCCVACALLTSMLQLGLQNVTFDFAAV